MLAYDPDAGWSSFKHFAETVGMRPPRTKLKRVDESKPFGPDNWQWRSLRPVGNWYHEQRNSLMTPTLDEAQVKLDKAEKKLLWLYRNALASGTILVASWFLYGEIQKVEQKIDAAHSEIKDTNRIFTLFLMRERGEFGMAEPAMALPEDIDIETMTDEELDRFYAEQAVRWDKATKIIDDFVEGQRPTVFKKWHQLTWVKKVKGVT